MMAVITFSAGVGAEYYLEIAHTSFLNRHCRSVTSISLSSSPFFSNGGPDAKSQKDGNHGRLEQLFQQREQ